MKFSHRVLKALKVLIGDVTSEAKIYSANKEVLKKMEEMDKTMMLNQISSLQKIVKEQSVDIKNLIALSKANNEFLINLCTTSEELLNLFSEGQEILIEGQTGDSPEDELDTEWASGTDKKDKLVN